MKREQSLRIDEEQLHGSRFDCAAKISLPTPTFTFRSSFSLFRLRRSRNSLGEATRPIEISKEDIEVIPFTPTAGHRSTLTAVCVRPTQPYPIRC